MNALENKPILQAAFAELATSYAKPFVDLMTDDFCWVCTGTCLLYTSPSPRDRG